MNTTFTAQLTPKSHAAHDLKEHAKQLAAHINSNMSKDERILLVSEVRNALAPIALIAGLDIEDITPEVMSDVKVSLNRVLALMSALA